MSKLNIDFLLITVFTSERFINNLLNFLVNIIINNDTYTCTVKLKVKAHEPKVLKAYRLMSWYCDDKNMKTCKHIKQT